MARTVRYYFAFGSPFAALADARIDDRVAGAGGILEPLVLVPPDLGPGPEGLAATLQEFKLAYVLEDAARWARRLGLAWNPPERVDTTAAAAGWYAAREAGRERAYRNGVFRAHWGEGADISDENVLADCAARAGLDREAFLEGLRSGRFHGRVSEALGPALADRVFGVPLFVLDGERFWGNDRLDFLLEALGA